MLLPRIPIQIAFPVNLPQVWTRNPTAEGDFVFNLSQEGSRAVLYNAEYIREAVLMVKTADDLLSFLTQFGDPGINHLGYVGTSEYKKRDGTSMTFKLHFPRTIHKVFLSQFLEVRMALKRAMDTDFETWNFGDLVDLQGMLDEMTVELKFSPRKLIGLCRMGNLVQACFASLFLEKFVQGVEYGWCQECGNHFERLTHHARKYCGPACGTKAALRAFRQRRTARLNAVRVRKRSKT